MHSGIYVFRRKRTTGSRFSKVPRIFRARKAIRKTTTYLFCKAGLLICSKGNKNKNNCKVSCLETPSFWRYKENYKVKLWFSHLLDNLSNCLRTWKIQVTQRDSNPWPLRCRCSALTNWATKSQFRAGQFVGFMFSRERNVVWKKCYMKCGIWNQVKIWSSHLLDNLSNCLMTIVSASQRSWVRIPLSHLNFSGSWDNCLNCPASARIISSLDFKYRTSYNISFILHSFHGKTWAQQIDLLSTVWLRSSVG